jgi:outer membrane scaffolding protein for murein synthesis (MipA/OmpV family)
MMVKPLVTAILLLSALPLFAAEKRLPLWEFGVGAGAIHFPDYRGSSRSQSYLLPVPAIVYRGERLKVDREGLRGLLLDSERLVLDISLDGAVPVDSDQNGTREGMPDLDATFEIGPSLKLTLHQRGPLEFRLNLPYRFVYASDFRHIDSHGALFNPNLSVSYNGRAHASFSAGPLYATNDYHDYYYRVDPIYATAERPAYDPNGGYSGMRYVAGFSRRYERHWLGAFIRYDDLAGAVFSGSPLVERQESWMGGLSLTWFFHRSSRTVSVDDSE